jgi:hypothetical protein
LRPPGTPPRRSHKVERVTDENQTELAELPVGTDVGTIEVILARLQADGIPVTIEPDLSSLSALDEESGFRLLAHPDDVAAIMPVLHAAGINPGA